MRNEAKEEYAEYVEDCQVALIRDWSRGDGILRTLNVAEADINSFSERWCKKYDSAFWKRWKEKQ